MGRDGSRSRNHSLYRKCLYGRYPDVITLTSGELVITTDVTINGPGADKLTISGNGGEPARVFNIGGQANVTVDSVAIANGNSGSANGGGILNSGNLILNKTAVRNNTAQNGGGVANNGGTLTIINSTLSNNAASQSGVASLTRTAYCPSVTARSAVIK